MTQHIQTLDDKERPLNPEHVKKRTKQVSQRLRVIVYALI